MTAQISGQNRGIAPTPVSFSGRTAGLYPANRGSIPSCRHQFKGRTEMSDPAADEDVRLVDEAVRRALVIPRSKQLRLRWARNCSAIRFQ